MRRGPKTPSVTKCDGTRMTVAAVNKDNVILGDGDQGLDDGPG